MIMTTSGYRAGESVGKQTYSVVELELGLEGCGGSSFNLANAVCNHGLFMMPPNLWFPSTNTFQRPLRLADSQTSVLVSISHPLRRTSLLIRVHGVHYIFPQDRQAILSQVRRMLRISAKDERDVEEFHKIHPEAKKRGFGRLFRSPTLFEDAVKSILLCNCSWARTLMMAKKLCVIQLKLSNGEDLSKNAKKRRGLKRNGASSECEADEYSCPGNFPSPKELAVMDVETLKRQCNVGYRAACILKLARKVADGKLKLSEFEEVGSCDYTKLSYKLVRAKAGFGDFACANVLMCNGHYEKVPADTETIRHLSHIRGMPNCNMKTVRAIVDEVYGNYAPFQCLAYWFELLEYYESKLGRLSKLPSSCYSTVTGAKMIQNEGLKLNMSTDGGKVIPIN